MTDPIWMTDLIRMTDLIGMADLIWMTDTKLDVILVKLVITTL